MEPNYSTERRNTPRPIKKFPFFSFVFLSTNIRGVRHERLFPNVVFRIPRLTALSERCFICAEYASTWPSNRKKSTREMCANCRESLFPFFWNDRIGEIRGKSASLFCEDNQQSSSRCLFLLARFPRTDSVLTSVLC